MLLSQQFAFFALASTILALPHHRFRQKQQDNGLQPGCVRQGKIVICTVTVTASRPGPTSNPVPTNNPAPINTPAPSPPAPQPTTTAAAPPPANTGNSQASTGNNDAAPQASGGQANYMAIVSKFRAAGGLDQLQQDSQLEGNARKTAADGNGQLVHQLNSGSFAQVLATGKESTFDKTYVESWLCEIPSLPGIGGLCRNTQNEAETGHAEILTDKKYKKIGCAFVGGVWACDLA